MKTKKFSVLLVAMAALSVLASCTKEKPGATKLELTPLKATLEIGETLKLTATVEPSTAVVTWITDKDNIATVDANGNVKAIGKGTALISAKVDDLIKTCQVVVVPVLESFELVPSDTLKITVTDDPASTKAKIAAKVEPSDLLEYLEAASEDPTIATVDNQGNVVAKYPGITKATATIGKTTREIVIKVIDKSSATGHMINGIALTNFITEDIFHDGTVKYTDNDSVFHLNNAHLSTTGSWLLGGCVLGAIQRGFVIEANGDNYLEQDSLTQLSTALFNSNICIFAIQNLKFIGNGSLTLSNLHPSSPCIAAAKEVDISCNKLTINSVNVGVSLNRHMYCNGSDLTITSAIAAIQQVGADTLVKIGTNQMIYEGDEAPGTQVEKLTWTKEGSNYLSKKYVHIKQLHLIP